MEGSINKPRNIDPIDDALYLACRKYMNMIDRGTSSQKNRQFAIIEELLLDRLDNNQFFIMPGEEDLPTEQLETQDTITEGQSVKLVAGVMRELEARRTARYVG